MPNKIIQMTDANGDNVYPVGFSMGGVKIDLLWTNPSPTSNFASQTVSLDLSTYEMVYITFKWQTSSADPFYSQITKVGCNGNVSAKETNNIYRTWEVSATGIAFNQGRYATSSGSASDNNSYAIPCEIYGIKMSYIVPTIVHDLQYVEI